MAEIIKMPRLSDTMTDGVVVKWHKKIGDKIEEGELLADIETDKATMEFESFQEGFLLHIGVKENETAEVDAILAILGKKDEDIKELLDSNQSNKVEEHIISKSENQKQEKIIKPSSEDRVKISPLAKKIAQEKKVDISMITGSGDGGRIIKRDIDDSRTQAVSIHTDLISEDKEIPLSQMRKTIANRLSESKFTSPHFYLNIEVEMDNLIASRKLLNIKNKIKISFNDIIVKAVARAIKKHPFINSSLSNNYIKLKSNINIGVAVSVDNGLVVPVIKNADLKSFSNIAEETNSFVKKAHENTLQPSDWDSNTFTISNLGMFGIDDFTAIINPPDACILAVGAIKQRPIVKEGVIVPGSIMRLTLSSDHRLVDGVVGAKFLTTLKDMLESPLMMFS